LPVWWCPWIHDYALLLGMVKHGVHVFLQKMWTEPDLLSPLTPNPFTREARQRHIEAVFLEGCEGIAYPFAANIFTNRTQRKIWLEEALATVHADLLEVHLISSGFFYSGFLIGLLL
jgi:hypothetical protein